ncbi:possible NAD/NADP octopine/nopaline dehydrogenase [Ectocarpus siliculosus]|uniref:Possible NAD/NADP octopine/nopaline dehydrogenase n=1 Tax=Ectocarpus siliculosus TaxID=2880 RepID=D8LGI9_ECTSI|nr:possible NAD/NADP octopine/nopaline dehydrogenase [Ectocarpus siliculosus]|eukprot:CBN79046.1 possible NAD/NADP octopine/nopaline dehydrogenase [Ectocarpus siliculosus]
MTISVATSSAEMERLSAAREGWRPIQATICGGGNGAHVAAGFLASRGIRVNVFTRQSKRWGDAITLSTEGSSWEKRGTITGALNLVTGDASQACAGSEVVIIAAPANAHPDLLRAVAPFVDDGAAVGALFAQGGFDWACVHSMGSHVNRVGCLFGLQNIPWICRINEYGKSAIVVGPKKKLYVASYPVEQRNEMALRVEAMFDIPCGTVPNFLNLTLTPSNQILHPARYYGIFWDWDGTKTYSKAELEERKGLTLYDNFDEFSAETLAAIDNELQQIKLALLQRFPQLDLSSVFPIGQRVKLHYGEDVSDTSSLKQIFCSNIGYKGCPTPLKEFSPGRFGPNVDTRLFWEDIPFGLCILKNLAEMLGNFPTPTMDFLIRWHQKPMGLQFLTPEGQLNPQLLERTGAPYKYGIHCLEDLVKTCMPQALLNYKHPRARL